MAASVSGSKTVTNDITPNLTAALLTTLLAIAPENLTVAQLGELSRALERTAIGDPNTDTVGSLLV